MTTNDRLDALEEVVAVLSAKDAIRGLAARYQRACDGGWDRPTHRDPDLLTSLFTADARYELPEMDEARGHAQIRDLFVRLAAMPWIIHYVANDLLTVDGDTARGEFKASAVFFRNGERILTFGTYLGEFRVVDGEWKFAVWHFVRAQQPVEVTG